MKIQAMAQAVSDNARWPTIYEWGKAIIGGAAIYSALAVFGVGITTPWPAQAEVTGMKTDLLAVQGEVKDMLVQQKQESCTLFRILRDNYRKDLNDAESDLAKNPNSTSAKRNKDEALDNIAQMDVKLHSAPCA